MINLDQVSIQSKIGASLFVLWMVLIPSSACAKSDNGLGFNGSLHPQTVIKAIALVSRKSVLIRAEIVADDLVKFHIVDSDDNKVYSQKALKEAMIKHQDLLVEKIVIRDVDGKKLAGKFHNLEPFEFPDAGVGEADLVDYFANYELEYVLEEPPSLLTFEQNLVDELTFFPSEMHLGIKQMGVEIGQGFVLTPGNPDTANFDWENLPPPSNSTAEQWTKFRNRQEEMLLGITNFRSVYSVITISRNEVRHEVVIPLPILARTTEIEREEESFLTIGEQDKVKEKLKRLLTGEIPLMIDGVEVQPIFDRVEFAGLRIKDLGASLERKTVSMVNGRVLFTIRYPTKSVPKQVIAEWNYFPPQIRRVESKIVYDENYEEFQFTKLNKLKSDETVNLNRFTWNNTSDPGEFSIANIPFSDPVKKYSVSAISTLAAGLLVLSGLILFFTQSSVKLQVGSVLFWLILAGLGSNFSKFEFSDPLAPKFSVTDEEAKRIAESLVRNVYRAFDYGEEEEVYTALSQSVNGELLNSIYLDVQTMRRIQEQGGAFADIRQVEFSNGKKESDTEDNGFKFKSDVLISGLVGHWGHFHERINSLTCEYLIQPIDGSWRIVSRNVVDSQTPKTQRAKLKKVEPSQGI